MSERCGLMSESTWIARSIGPSSESVDLVTSYLKSGGPRMSPSGTQQRKQRTCWLRSESSGKVIDPSGSAVSPSGNNTPRLRSESIHWLRSESVEEEISTPGGLRSESSGTVAKLMGSGVSPSVSRQAGSGVSR